MKGISLSAIGGGSAILYAVVTLILYLWTRWGILTGGEADQVLTMIGQRQGEWIVLWWGSLLSP